MIYLYGLIFIGCLFRQHQTDRSFFDVFLFCRGTLLNRESETNVSPDLFNETGHLWTLVDGEDHSFETIPPILIFEEKTF